MGKQLPDDLNTLKVTELKEALKERSLTVSGNKAELVTRLQDFLTKQAPKSDTSSDTPQKQAPAESESEPQNGAKDEEEVKEKGGEEDEEKEKEAQQKEKEKARREKERREKEEKEQREKEEKEKERREKERREKDRKEEELKEKELKEKERKEKERKEKEREREQEEQKTEKEVDKSTKSSKDEDKESQEGKKRKNTDDKESDSSTTTPTKSSATSPSSTPSSTTTTPSNNKRVRTSWANNKTQSPSVNISTDILKEMLPTPTSPKEGEDAEMADDAGEDAGSARRPAQQVYSAPVRREKKEDESVGAREVPQSRKPASNTLFIDRFVRPFTIPQVKQLLEKTGDIEYFWMNQVKSQAYATFKTVEQATATRDAIFDLLWPPGNGSKLRAEFATEDEAKRVAEQHDLKRSSTPTTTTTPTTAPFGKGDRLDSRQDLRDSRDLKDSRDSRDSLRGDSLREARNVRDSREALRDSRGTRGPLPPPKKTLEDLFHKTVALPSIYWLGLTAEQIAAKKSTSAHDR